MKEEFKRFKDFANQLLFIDQMATVDRAFNQVSLRQERYEFNSHWETYFWFVVFLVITE